MISVFGLAGGPLLGVIVMGMFFPCVNGAVCVTIFFDLAITYQHYKSNEIKNICICFNY